MEPSTIIRAYIPQHEKHPEQTNEIKRQETIRKQVDEYSLKYSWREERLKRLITQINIIVQEAVGKNNEKNFIDSGYLQCDKPGIQTSGRNMVYSPEYEAYKFLIGENNFNDDKINIEVVNKTVENLKRKALECHATKKLFAIIYANDDFQAHPSQFEEKWRKATIKPSSEERKVIKCFSSMDDDGVLHFRVLFNVTIK